jgi:hypothetical protein
MSLVTMPVVPCGYFFFESQVSLVNDIVNTTLPFSLRAGTFSVLPAFRM